jgi:C4-dicarboxylate transporter DctM subunit
MAEIAKAPVAEVIRGMMPFLWAMILLLGIIIFFPGLTTWLPDLVLGPPK